jgi:hypothetical protein
MLGLFGWSMTTEPFFGPFHPLKRTWNRVGQTPSNSQMTWPMSLSERAPCSRRC